MSFTGFFTATYASFLQPYTLSSLCFVSLFIYDFLLILYFENIYHISHLLFFYVASCTTGLSRYLLIEIYIYMLLRPCLSFFCLLVLLHTFEIVCFSLLSLSCFCSSLESDIWGHFMLSHFRLSFSHALSYWVSYFMSHSSILSHIYEEIAV